MPECILTEWVISINKFIVIPPRWLLHGVFGISIYVRNFNQTRLSSVGFGFIYRNESKTLAPKYFVGILLLWFSRGLSTCALLSEETGQLINRPGNAMARIHQVWMKSLGSYLQPHPLGFSPYLKRTLGVFLGWFGTIDASPGCSVMWKSDVQFQKKTRPFLFYFCVVKVCYKDVIGLLPCLRVKASICPFMASETFSSRWSRLPVLRFCERRESCEENEEMIKEKT